MLESSMAIAGAATVRNWRTGAAIGASGEPLNRRKSSVCASVANCRLNSTDDRCACSHSMRLLRAVPCVAEVVAGELCAGVVAPLAGLAAGAGSAGKGREQKPGPPPPPLLER